jgi:hypothetical protein
LRQSAAVSAERELSHLAARHQPLPRKNYQTVSAIHAQRIETIRAPTLALAALGFGSLLALRRKK